MSEYKANNIKVLKGLEAVRKRPGMYIGDTAIKGLHHLIYEVVDNSIDEAMAGYANKIKVKINKDGSAEIEDNGRGIPTDIHPQEKIPAATVVLTILHAGGKFDNKTYKVSGGLHGVGVSVVNALSKKLIMTIKRNGNVYTQEFEKGKPITDLEIIGTTNRTGTSIKFYPDDEIFETTQFKSEILQKRLKELAYLNPNITIQFENEQDGVKETYHFEGGIKDFVKTLTNKECTTDVLAMNEHYEDEEKAKKHSYHSYIVPLLNTSPGGYCLQWPNQIPGSIQAGEIVGIRESTNHNWSLAVIRWIRQIRQQGTQIGIELLAPLAEPCGVQLLQKTGAPSEYLRALLLPELSAIGQPATLITPRLPFQTGQKVFINQRGEETKCQLSKRVTATGSFSQFELKFYSSQTSAVEEPPKNPLKTENQEDNFDSLWPTL